MTITNPRRFGVFCVVILAVIFFVGNWFIGGQILRSGEVTIADGMIAKKVWSTLAHDGYTHTTWPWRYWDWRLHTSPKIKAGTYKVTKGESVQEVLGRFISGNVLSHELSVTYPEGFTLDQIAARTAAQAH